ncbi:GmrSD restriction endonuclease domain-containing protein [Pararhodobacter aggregans]
MMSLQDQVNRAKRTVNTDSLSFSINEFIGMYESGEININPAFQRTFRWGPEQQSNLIESLLIGVPLPPVFVYENTDGTWELIDGLQRSSTIIKFFGKLKVPGSDELQPPSVLIATEYLPDLNNVVWQRNSLIEDVPLDQQIELDSAQQLFLKRCRINVEVLKQPSSNETKFDLFQRLNRGGSVANDQEIRTCLVVMKSPAFAEVLAELASSEEMQVLCRISADDVKKQKDVEFATRIVCHAYKDLRVRDDLNEFLDRSVLEIIDEANPSEIKERYFNSIKMVYAAGEDALIPKHGRRKVFTLQGLETIIVGVCRNYNAIAKLANPTEFVVKRVQDFWNSEEMKVYTSSGMSASDRIRQTVPLGDGWFDPS